MAGNVDAAVQGTSALEGIEPIPAGCRSHRAISSFRAGIISISAGGLSGCGQATHLARTVRTESRMPDANVTASHPSPRQTTAPDSSLLNIPVDLIAKVLTRLGLLREDVDYHLVRASMVLIFLMFGYQKWFEYE